MKKHIRDLDLTASQLAKLEELVSAGFQLVSIPHIERYVAVEKQGFVALLDPSQDRLKIFGEVGYRIGEGVGMLVDRKEGKVFVHKEDVLFPTPALLARYERVKAELRRLLGGAAPKGGA